MYLKRLSILHFKNYATTDLAFSRGFNCFFGRNGAGKTNLLDAIYYLCMTKSYFGIPDAQVLQAQAPFLRLDGWIEGEADDIQYTLKYVPKKLKSIAEQSVPKERMADHIGHLPVVLIAPDDAALLTEGSELRRRFVDNTLSQMDAQYLTQLITYNRVLQQRNALLKQMSERGAREDALLDVLTRQLLAPAAYILESRKSFLASLAPVFHGLYQFISESREEASLAYDSRLLQQPYAELLERAREKDLFLQRSTEGIHRDDLECRIDGVAVKKFASQGQRKSYLIALKLAQMRLLGAATGKAPLLLLDDLFEKLDPGRLERLFALLNEEDLGQVFITDTDAARIRAAMSKSKRPYALFLVENGQISAPIPSDDET